MSDRGIDNEGFHEGEYRQPVRMDIPLDSIPKAKPRRRQTPDTNAGNPNAASLGKQQRKTANSVDDHENELNSTYTLPAGSLPAPVYTPDPRRSSASSVQTYVVSNEDKRHLLDNRPRSASMGHVKLNYPRKVKSEESQWKKNVVDVREHDKNKSRKAVMNEVRYLWHFMYLHCTHNSFLLPRHMQRSSDVPFYFCSRFCTDSQFFPCLVFAPHAELINHTFGWRTAACFPNKCSPKTKPDD